MSEQLELTAPNLRRALGSYATGVTVVTARQDNSLRGMTVNSFTSVSLRPPLILYCSTPGTTLEVVKQSQSFAVNILAHNQLELARRFAGQTGVAEGERFIDIDFLFGPLTGCPLLGDCLAGLECQVRQIVSGGDHDIVIAEVVAIHVNGQNKPLLFYRGQFPTLGE